jgi:hypothetical protein
MSNVGLSVVGVSVVGIVGVVTVGVGRRSCRVVELSLVSYTYWLSYLCVSGVGVESIVAEPRSNGSSGTSFSNVGGSKMRGTDLIDLSTGPDYRVFWVVSAVQTRVK